MSDCHLSVSPRPVQKMVMSSLHLQADLRKKGSHCTSIFSCLSDAMKSLYSSGQKFLYTLIFLLICLGVSW